MTFSKFHKRNYVGKAFRILCSKFQVNRSGIGRDTASQSFDFQLVAYTIKIRLVILTL